MRHAAVGSNRSLHLKLPCNVSLRLCMLTRLFTDLWLGLVSASAPTLPRPLHRKHLFIHGLTYYFLPNGVLMSYGFAYGRSCRIT